MSSQGPVRLEGGSVLLRPFGKAEERIIVAGRRGMEPHLQVPVGEPSRSRVLRRIERSGHLWRGRIDLGIDVGGQLIGDVQASTGWGHFFPPGVFELGITIWDRDRRGQGHGSEAVELITRWLFVEMKAARVQLSTWVENAAMRRTAEKLGYDFEGTLNAYWPRPDGGRDDYAMYAITSFDQLRRGS